MVARFQMASALAPLFAHTHTVGGSLSHCLLLQQRPTPTARRARGASAAASGVAAVWRKERAAASAYERDRKSAARGPRSRLDCLPALYAPLSVRQCLAPCVYVIYETSSVRADISTYKRRRDDAADLRGRTCAWLNVV